VIMQGNLFLIITDSTRRDGKLTSHRYSKIERLSELMYNKIKDDTNGLEKKVYLVTTTEPSSEEGAKIILKYFEKKNILYEKNNFEKLWVEYTLTIENPITDFLYNKFLDHKDYPVKIICARKNVLNALGGLVNKKKELGIKRFSITPNKHGYCFNFQSNLHYSLD